jgi:hypothetical protein
MVLTAINYNPDNITSSHHYPVVDWQAVFQYDRVISCFANMIVIFGLHVLMDLFVK